MLLAVTACSFFGRDKPGPGQPGWVDADGVAQNGPGKPAPACITPPDESGTITRASPDGLSRVRFCIGEGAQCFSLDLASAKLERLATPPPVATATTEAHVETRNPELKVCAADACKTLTPKVIPQTAQLRAATNPNGTTFVVLLGDAASGKGYAEIWDVGKSKKVTSFPYARGDFKCGDVAMLGNAIYISASECKSPAARGALYSLKGAKVANVGNKDFGVYGDEHVQLSASQWAFLEENGNLIAIQDVFSGKVVKTIKIAGLFGDGKDAFGNPGESALLKLADGRLAVIAGSPANGSVAVVDPTTSEVKITKAPLCQ